MIPFADAVQSCVSADQVPAWRNGFRTGTSIAAARRLSPGIALVAQQPDLYVGERQRIVAEALDVLPIDAVCSFDELTASIVDRDSPVAVAQQVEQRVSGRRGRSHHLHDRLRSEPLACQDRRRSRQAVRSRNVILHFSPRGEAKCVRGPSGLGASRAEEKARAAWRAQAYLNSTLSTASKRNEVLAVVSRASTVGW